MGQFDRKYDHDDHDDDGGDDDDDDDDLQDYRIFESEKPICAALISSA